MLEVRGDTDVGFQQVVLPVVERNPGFVEEHVLVRHAEFLRQQARLRHRFHLRHVRVGMLDAQEEQAHVGVFHRDLRDRADKSAGIEPVVDSAAPDDDLVVESDAGCHPADGGPGLDRVRAGDAERGHGDQGIELAVAGVGERVDAPEASQLTEPEVALPVTGTEEEITDEQLVVQRVRRVVHLLVPQFQDLAAALLQLLEVEGIVNVDDDHLGRAFQSREQCQGVPLHDDDVRPLLMLHNGAGAVVRDDGDLERIVE